MEGISIPQDLQPHADFICDSIRQAIADSNVAVVDDVKVVRPTAKQFGVGEVALVMLLIGGKSAGWFTKKWLDEYLWPILKKQVDRPSRQILELLSVYVARSPR